jgi:hypothetical protein
LKTSNAVHVFTCGNGGEWTYATPTASGDLLDSNTSEVVGSYIAFNTSSRLGINLTLWNSNADFAESGFLTSSVTASPIATVKTNILTPENLSQATSHHNLGAAATVSYIALLNPQGGQPPAASLCTQDFGELESISVQVPFSAEFRIYTQDVVPPPVPASLNVPDGRLVEGYFAQGSISYLYNGSAWLQRSTSALLYKVAGGCTLGTFENLRNGSQSSLSWHIVKPTELSLTGQNFVNPVVLSTADVPWALFKITSSKGNMSLAGPFTYVQLVSTRGGTAPLLSDSVGLPTGLVWTSAFSGIFWFYTNST